MLSTGSRRPGAAEQRLGLAPERPLFLTLASRETKKKPTIIYIYIYIYMHFFGGGSIYLFRYMPNGHPSLALRETVGSSQGSINNADGQKPAAVGLYETL